MELTVYRQAQKVRPDGTIVYKGEDAKPYVDGQIFLVADGMGGLSAIRHLKFKPELFDCEKLTSVLFEGVYEDYSDERFTSYVLDSFFEFFAVKDCYTVNINNIKKSAYFASRLVSAILVHEMLYNTEYSAAAIIGALDAAEGEEAKQEKLKEFGAHFKEVIQTKMKKIAENANFIYESSYMGLALLGTTLCATIYVEKEDCVEAVYLTAGDSRPYVWSKEDGLCQILSDQEGKDGAMTNYISITEGDDFDIYCNHFTFAKPCVLFNASDGCFDSGRFFSQMAFEKLILDSALKSETTEQLSEYLTDFFRDNGRHDDSSTIAMKFFGYADLEDFKSAAAKRLEVLDTEYLSKMSDLLEIDYSLAYEQYTTDWPKQLNALRAKFEGQAAVKAYCQKQIVTSGYAPYVEAMEALDRKIAEKQAEIKVAAQKIGEVLSDNFVALKNHMNLNLGFNDKNTMHRVEEITKKRGELLVASTAKLERFNHEFGEMTAYFQDLLARTSTLGVLAAYEAFDAADFRDMEKHGEAMQDLLDFFSDMRDKKSDTVKKLISLQAEAVEKNRKLSEKHASAIELLSLKLVHGEIKPDELSLVAEERERILAELQVIRAKEEEIRSLQSEGKDKAVAEACAAYWATDYVDVIWAVIHDPESGLEPALAEEATVILTEYKEKTEMIREKGEKQRSLFTEYDKTYCKYIGGEQ